MDHETLGFEIAQRFSTMGVNDERCLELALAKAEEAVTQQRVAAVNVETVSTWVRANYPQWFGAAPGTVAVNPAPQPAPSAPTSNPAPSVKGDTNGEAAPSATGHEDAPLENEGAAQ